MAHVFCFFCSHVSPWLKGEGWNSGVSITISCILILLSISFSSSSCCLPTLHRCFHLPIFLSPFTSTGRHLPSLTASHLPIHLITHNSMMQPIMEDHTTPSPRYSTEKLLSSSSSSSSTLGRFSNNDTDDERSDIPDWPLRGVGSQRHRRLRAAAVVGILVTSILLNIVLVICMLHRGWSVKKVVETSLAKPMLYCKFLSLTNTYLPSWSNHHITSPPLSLASATKKARWYLAWWYIK